MLAALVVLLLAVLPPSVPAASNYSHLSLSLGAGHDTQVLVQLDPRGGVDSDVAPVAEDFGAGSLKLLTRWSGLGFADRLTVIGEVSGVRYGDASIGTDFDLRLHSGLRRHLSANAAVDAELSWWRYRREQLPEYNVDLVRALGRVAWSPSRPWLFTGAARFNLVEFPDRSILPDTSEVVGPGDVVVTPVDPTTETDNQTDVLISGLLRLGSSGFAAVELLHRWSTSNEPLVEYRGPMATVRVGSAIPAEVDVSGYLSYGRRTFQTPYTVAFTVEDNPETAERIDHALQFGFLFQRPISRRARLFGDGAWLRQRSSVEDFSYNQARFSVGVTVDLWTRDPARRVTGLEPGAPSPLTPTPSVHGMRFRFRAPGATRVSLVGDFNGWDEARHPLTPIGDGVFERVVPLAEGIWRYAFVVDGEWRRPPDAPRYEADGFGGENGVLQVAEPVPNDVTQTGSTRLNCNPGTPVSEPGVAPGARSPGPTRLIR